LTSGFISRTTNGGSTWDLVLGGIRNVLNDVWFSDRLRGWAVGASRMVLRTTDGGRTWDPVSVSSSASQYNAMSFVSDGRGGIVGNHRSIVHTSDAGQTWSEQPTGLSGSVIWEDAQFIDENTGWIVGRQSSNGLILHTADGGLSWSPQQPAGSDQVNAVYFVDASTGWAVGRSGLILHTANGGATWIPQENGTTWTFSDLFFIDSMTGWAVSITGILHTTDGGATWTQQAGVFGGLSGIIGAQSVRFTDAQHGRIVGTVGLMAETSDGGETWTALEFGNGINSVVTSNPLHAIHLFDFDTGWAVGGTGTILRLGDLPDVTGLPGPALRAGTFSPDGAGGFRLTWTPGEAGWSLESTRDLAGSEWDAVEHGTPPGQGEVTVELLTDAPQRFFRLRRSGGP
jgi:photosystem II stability/assembly factor-like uncharacterized protein